MVQELVRGTVANSEYVRFRFDEPTHLFPPEDVATFFTNLAALSELVFSYEEIYRLPEKNFERLTYLTPKDPFLSYDDYHFLTWQNYESMLERLNPRTELDVVSFSFASPIEVLIRAGAKVSNATLGKIMAAYKHVVHHSAMDRKLHAEADLSEHIAMKARLENIQKAIKIHESVRDPAMQERLARVVHDTLVPFSEHGKPKLKSIELSDDHK